MPTRAERVLARIRATPEGFVRAYGDVSPGAPRFAGSRAVGVRRPERALAPDRARRRLAGQGRPPAALLEAEGVPFVGERVDMRAARLPD